MNETSPEEIIERIRKLEKTLSRVQKELSDVKASVFSGFQQETTQAATAAKRDGCYVNIEGKKKWNKRGNDGCFQKSDS